MPHSVSWIDRIRIERLVWTLDQRIYELPWRVGPADWTSAVPVCNPQSLTATSSCRCMSMRLAAVLRPFQGRDDGRARSQDDGVRKPG